MTIFTEAEMNYLTSERLLARIATVGSDGTPHIAPVGWSLDPDSGVIQMGGYNLTATKKFKDITRTGRAAIVIDDVLPPWQPRGVEIRGRAEATSEPEPVIRIYPERVIGWGLDSTDMGARNARDVDTPAT